MDLAAGFLAGIVASVFFWPVLVVLLIISLALFENRPFFSSIFVLGFGALLYFFLKPWLPPLTVGSVAAGVGIYAVIGLLWSILKWYLKSKRISNLLDEFRAGWVKDDPESDAYFTSAKSREMSDLLDQRNRTQAQEAEVKKYETFMSQLDSHFQKNKVYVGTGPRSTFHSFLSAAIPRASKNKGAITSWIFYWPLSIVTYIVGDLFYNLADWVYLRVVGVFARITRSMFKQYE